MEKKNSLKDIVTRATAGLMSEQNVKDLLGMFDYEPDKELLGSEISDIQNLNLRMDKCITFCFNYNKLRSFAFSFFWSICDSQKRLKTCEKKNTDLLNEYIKFKNDCEQLKNDNDSLKQKLMSYKNEMIRMETHMSMLENKGGTMKTWISNSMDKSFENENRDIPQMNQNVKDKKEK